VLGVLDVTLSLASVDATIVRGRRALLLNLVGAVVVISGIFGGLIWGLVHRPVKKLHLGTQSVAAGNLDYKIELSSRDEIGQLAASFNRMTTELKKANEELKEWARTLETRVDEKTGELKRAHEHMIQVERMASMGKLAAIVAHEINNPLTGILVSSRFILKRLAGSGQAEQEPREHLEMIANEASRCGEIVKSLLQFTPQAKAKYEACDVKELILDAVRLVKHKLDLMSVRLKQDLDPDAPPILCDPQEIRQALVAILINACEAMPQGEGLLEVGVRYHADGPAVDVWVKDSGIGMDDETQKHMFEPFFTTKQDSHGVGLCVVSGIVSRHSGNIEVSSAPGKGTTISMRLPVSGAAARDPQ
jgi:two-component system NtrC family sensor kinase